MHELVAAAGEYLTLGLQVIALNGKMPNGKVHPHGLREPLSGAPEGPDDWALLERIFTRPDVTGVGILTSFPYLVVDVDGEEGAAAWKDLVGEADFIPDRWVAKTGRGLHMWFGTMQPTGSMKLGPKLDLKADGGYVAAPPSLHPEGHRYEWLLPPTLGDGGLGAPMEVPDPLAERIAQHVFDLQRRIEAKHMRRRVRHQPFEGGRLWASFGFDHLIEAMKAEPPGNRNNFLHWAAATMAEEGATDEEFEQLIAAAPDLGAAARRTVRSARRGRG